MPKQKKRKSSPRKKAAPKPLLPLKYFSLLFIAIGIIFLLIPGIFYINKTIQLTYFTPPFSRVSQSTLPKPISLSIPQIRLSLPLETTYISHNTWGIAKNGASYLDNSARPGENGAIILYGHNTDDRFGPIRWLTKGDKITLVTSDKKVHNYVIEKTLEVSPDEVTVFEQTSETLILYTCSGFADTKRFIVIAKPDKGLTDSLDSTIRF